MTKLGAVAQKKEQIIATEHHLRLEADPHRAKIIAEAIRGYMNKNSLDDTTLSDFVFIIETGYQSHYGLGEDDWGFIASCGNCGFTSGQDGWKGTVGGELACPQCGSIDIRDTEPQS